MTHPRGVPIAQPLRAQAHAHEHQCRQDPGRPGPRVLLRAELDALPIGDRSGSPHASERANISHACGHDGHSAMLAGLAMRIATREVRLDRGAALLLFQPAEETGAGERSPGLHNAEYDFPDALLPTDLRLLECLTERLCGGPGMEV